MFNNKHFFWIAFVLASLIFWFGILLGISFEKSRVDEVKNVYFDSETEIFDFEISSDLILDLNMSCDMIYQKSILFADSIYKEASKLEKYDDSNKITEGIVPIHKRYDLLRTLLWKDLINARLKCEKKTNVVVYFYEYVDPSLTTRGMQGTMSNFLVELKKEYENDIILIPIAVDTGLGSLQILLDYYGLDKAPSIFINEEIKLESLSDLKDFDKSIFSTNSSNRINLKN
jgi:hypothetical protein